MPLSTNKAALLHLPYWVVNITVAKNEIKTQHHCHGLGRCVNSNRLELDNIPNSDFTVFSPVGMSAPPKPDTFDCLNKMTEDALSRPGSRRVVTAPNPAARDPKTPDPRRITTVPPDLPLSTQWKQMSHQKETETPGWETVDSRDSLLEMPEPPQHTPEPSPLELYVQRRAERALSRSTLASRTNIPSSSTKATTETPTSGTESPLEKVLDTFTEKVRLSGSFEELSEEWDEIDAILAEAREEMEGKMEVEKAPSLDELIERLRHLDDGDSEARDWPAPLKVRRRRRD